MRSDRDRDEAVADATGRRPDQLPRPWGAGSMRDIDPDRHATFGDCWVVVEVWPGQPDRIELHCTRGCAMPDAPDLEAGKQLAREHGDFDVHYRTCPRCGDNGDVVVFSCPAHSCLSLCPDCEGGPVVPRCSPLCVSKVGYLPRYGRAS